MSTNLLAAGSWVPKSCTLPTVEQPLRMAEFDCLFAKEVLHIKQVSPSRITLALRAEPEVAAKVARLATAETTCCSFFSFGLTITGGHLDMSISVDPSHEDLLAALNTRATALVAST